VFYNNIRDHVKAHNSIGLSVAKKSHHDAPVAKVNRFAIDTSATFGWTGLPHIDSPHSLSGLTPVKEGRQSTIKFSVHKPLQSCGNEMASLLDRGTSVNADEDDSLWGENDEREKAWRIRKIKLEYLNQGKETQKMGEIHGPAGAGRLHVQ
jgi:hypothetical protein